MSDTVFSYCNVALICHNLYFCFHLVLHVVQRVCRPHHRTLDLEEIVAGMPYTPARTARELEKQERARDAGRQQNEIKYSEFKINCDEGDPGSCNSLGEWWALMRQDFRQALDLYTTTCLERRYPQACLNLGNMLCEC